MKKRFLIIVLILLGLVSHAQQESEYTQYMYNTNIINPAYAGSRGTLNFFLLGRAQWIGITGAPRTNNFSGDMLLRRDLGLGLSIVNDEAGALSNNTFNLDFSYIISLDGIYKLSFGLKPSISMMNVDTSKLTGSEGDALFQAGVDGNGIIPNVGIGTYLYSEKFYVGLSSPKILPTKYLTTAPDGAAGEKYASSAYTQKLHLYLISGYVMELSRAVDFKPSVMIKYAQSGGLAGDISANFLMNKKFIGGLSYRVGTSVSAMIGFQPTRKFLLGYAYDYDTTIVGQFSSGSHEVFLRYEFSTKDNYSIAPRFF